MFEVRIMNLHYDWYEKYSDAVVAYREFVETETVLVSLLQDGYPIKDNRPTTAYAITGEDCIGILYMHSDRGVRSHVVRFVWNQETGDHMIQRICDYDTKTCDKLAFTHAMEVACSENLLCTACDWLAMKQFSTMSVDAYNSKLFDECELF